MANQICIRAQTDPGDEIVVEQGGHSYNFETGATAALAGVQVRPVAGRDGIFDADDLRAAIRPNMIAYPRTRGVCIENTHNAAGGTVWSLAELGAVSEVAHAAGLWVHLDGARLFNAAVALGVDVGSLASAADTVSVCLSKGLGAPVGSVIAGSAPFIDRARRLRKQLGGGMRQAGILAAAGLWALEHNVDRLGEDHQNARALAEGLRALGWVDEVPAPPTNIVMAHLAQGLQAPPLVEAMAQHGVLAHVFGPARIRFVTHLDVGPTDIQAALGRLAALPGLAAAPHGEGRSS
jgi:threonine aldolase